MDTPIRVPNNKHVRHAALVWTTVAGSCLGVVMPNTELLTAQEVADRLAVHVESVRRWTRQGDLSAVRLPSGRYRYRSEDVDTMVRGDAA